MQKRLGIVALLFAVVLACILLATYRPWVASSESHLTDVRINAPFPAIDFAPFYVAKDKKWIERALAEVRARPIYVGAFGEIAISLESIATNRIDFIFTSAIPAIVGRAGGTDLRIVWLSCVLLSDVTVQIASHAKALSDLRSNKVATLGGSDSHYWLLRNLEQAGLPRDFLDIVIYARPDDVMAAFDARKVDAVALFPPFPEQSIATGAARYLGGPEAPIEVVLVGREAFINEHRNIVQALQSVLDRAKSWIIQHPGEAQAIVAAQTGIDLSVVKLSWPKLDWEATLNQHVIQDIQDKANFLEAEGRVSRKVHVSTELLIQ